MGQYFSNEQLPSKIKTFETMLLGTKYEFFTDNGVFCKDYLDFGSRLLLESIPPSEVGKEILDVGCGYGPIGIILAKQYGSHVDMVDINKRAVHLAKMNAKRNGVENLVTISVSHCYENVTKKYSTIVTNPPIRAGKQVIYEILFKAKEHLLEHGNLYLVIRKDQGAKSVMTDLEREYHVEVLERKKGFFILKCSF